MGAKETFSTAEIPELARERVKDARTARQMTWQSLVIRTNDRLLDGCRQHTF